VTVVVHFSAEQAPFVREREWRGRPVDVIVGEYSRSTFAPVADPSFK